jgi:hypothetical protein
VIQLRRTNGLFRKLEAIIRRRVSGKRFPSIGSTHSVKERDSSPPMTSWSSCFADRATTYGRKGGCRALLFFGRTASNGYLACLCNRHQDGGWNGRRISAVLVCASLQVAVPQPCWRTNRLILWSVSIWVANSEPHDLELAARDSLGRTPVHHAVSSRLRLR